jgi:hypothetical protein
MFFDRRPNTWIRVICVILTTELGATACRSPMPCPDCDDWADDMPENTVPDLPCGGADLLTDPLNCGECGNDCVQYAGTGFEVGSCQMGLCTGPSWSDCAYWAYGETCGEICADANDTCIAGGCSGYTALLIQLTGLDEICSDQYPYATMHGSCDEPIPWDNGGEFVVHAMCCCAE